MSRFAEIARRRFGGSLAGTIALTAGLGGMGGAQPLAVTHERGRRAPASTSIRAGSSGACGRATSTSAPTTSRTRCNAASARSANAVRSASGSAANAAEVLPELVRAWLRARCGHRPDLVPTTPLNGYVPDGLSIDAAAELRQADPDEYVRRARAAAAAHCFAMVSLQGRRQRGLRLRQQPARRGRARRASSAPSTTRASSPPTSGRCSARARARFAGWRCPATRPTSPPPTARCSRSFPGDEALARWIRMAAERIAFQGLPARICWLGYGERRRLGLRFNRPGARAASCAPRS